MSFTFLILQYTKVQTIIHVPASQRVLKQSDCRKRKTKLELARTYTKVTSLKNCLKTKTVFVLSLNSKTLENLKKRRKKKTNDFYMSLDTAALNCLAESPFTVFIYVVSSEKTFLKAVFLKVGVRNNS